MDMRQQSLIVDPGAINPATRIGGVHLTVADLEGQIAFYEQVIGLKLLRRDGGTASLGGDGDEGSAPDEELLRLSEVRGARRAKGRTGIYHFAILLPSRKELGRVIARLFSLRYPNSPTDHVMTQTTYLEDPEGNTIEIYADTPEEGVMGVVKGEFIARRVNGIPSSGRDPLDVEALFRMLTPEDRLDEPMPAETKMGHVHLYVADLDETMHFYHDILGFDNMGIGRSFRMGMVSAGGYHHHIGFNTWLGEGAPPPPAEALGLRYFKVVLPDGDELGKLLERVQGAGVTTLEMEDGVLVRDPSQNGVLLSVQRSKVQTL
jgi:catechol 2,3-dioxygenase